MKYNAFTFIIGTWKNRIGNRQLQRRWKRRMLNASQMQRVLDYNESCNRRFLDKACNRNCAFYEVMIYRNVQQHGDSIHIVYVIESAAYGVLFTSCLCQKPERARYERVRAFDTNNEWIKPRTKHFLCRELFLTQNKRIFIELAFWTQIRNKNSLTIEPNASLI